VSYRVEFLLSAQRDLAGLSTRIASAVVEFCTGPLSEDPHRLGKPLRAPYLGLYAARRGDYRVLYSIHDDRVVVRVVNVRHRARAYRSSGS
jgi:mRNA-degrading endonuclease RelE of RelBE toxin-antitoxin system